MANKKLLIPEATRREVILRAKGTCCFCGKQGIIGYRNKGFSGSQCTRLTVWEVREIPSFFFRQSLLRNPDGSNTWIVPFHLHHVIPIRLGGNNEASNIKLACRSCHSKTAAYDRDNFKKAGLNKQLGMWKPPVADFQAA